MKERSLTFANLRYEDFLSILNEPDARKNLWETDFSEIQEYLSVRQGVRIPEKFKKTLNWEKLSWKKATISIYPGVMFLGFGKKWGETTEFKLQNAEAIIDLSWANQKSLNKPSLTLKISGVISGSNTNKRLFAASYALDRKKVKVEEIDFGILASEGVFSDRSKNNKRMLLTGSCDPSETAGIITYKMIKVANPNLAFEGQQIAVCKLENSKIKNRGYRGKDSVFVRHEKPLKLGPLYLNKKEDLYRVGLNKSFRSHWELYIPGRLD